VSIAWDSSYMGRLRKLAGDEPTLMFVGARCVAIDDTGRVLLIRRSDTGDWALPAGAMELGESITECAAREFFEETGLTATELAPFACYSAPRFTGRNQYGHIYQVFTTAFQVTAWTGTLLTATDETTDACFYDPGALPEPLGRSVPETLADHASFERTGTFVAK
jgi:ADP-ribose pyrophosphatase YjhB (NUDIX family)